MGLITKIDTGFGVYSEEGYIRIAEVAFSPNAKLYSEDPESEPIEIPQWSIDIHVYFDKRCRNFEIIKDYVESKFVKSYSYSLLSEDKKAWIHDNITARFSRPIQTMVVSTIDTTAMPPSGSSKAAVLEFFYNWLKDNPVFGRLYSSVFDEDLSYEDIVKDFISQHPEIFGA